jgi:hypothetical protein
MSKHDRYHSYATRRMLQRQGFVEILNRGQVRTFADMSDEERQALERQYGARIKAPEAKRP